MGAFRREHFMNSEYARVSKLGFGCMRLPLTDPKDVTAIDIEQVKQMVDTFMPAAGTYFDTAFVYHNGHLRFSRSARRAPPARNLHHRHEMPRLGVPRRRNSEGVPGHVA